MIQASHPRGIGRPQVVCRRGLTKFFGLGDKKKSHSIWEPERRGFYYHPAAIAINISRVFHQNDRTYRSRLVPECWSTWPLMSMVTIWQCCQNWRADGRCNEFEFWRRTWWLEKLDISSSMRQWEIRSYIEHISWDAWSNTRGNWIHASQLMAI